MQFLLKEIYGSTELSVLFALLFQADSLEGSRSVQNLPETWHSTQWELEKILEFLLEKLR